MMDAIFHFKRHQLKALENGVGHTDLRNQICLSFKQKLANCLMEEFDFDDVLPCPKTIERKIIRSSQDLYSTKLNAERIEALHSLISVILALLNSEHNECELVISDIEFKAFSVEPALLCKMNIPRGPKFTLLLKGDGCHSIKEKASKYSLEIGVIKENSKMSSDLIKLVEIRGQLARKPEVVTLLSYLHQVQSTGISYDNRIQNWSVTPFDISEGDKVVRSILNDLDGGDLCEETALDMMHVFHPDYMKELNFACGVDLDTAKVHLRSLSNYIFGDSLTCNEGFQFGSRLAEHLGYHTLISASTKDRVKEFASDFVREQFVYSINEPNHVQAALEQYLKRIEVYARCYPFDSMHSKQLLDLQSDWFMEAVREVFSDSLLDDDDLIDGSVH